MAKAEKRRRDIAHLLLAEERAITGAELSARFGVSRQIIVRDISLLKAEGFSILATHGGYLIQASPFKERAFKVHHTTDETEEELGLIVDLGGTVVDVFVWHKAYGKMSAKLNIQTRQQVKQFIDNVRGGKSVELMHITGGYHYHTVRAENEAVLDEIEAALKEKNYIVSED